MPNSHIKNQHGKTLIIFLIASCTLLQFYFCLRTTDDLRLTSFIFGIVLIVFYSWFIEAVFNMLNIRRVILFYDFKGTVFEIVLTIVTMFILNRFDTNALFYYDLVWIVIIEIILQVSICVVLFLLI